MACSLRMALGSGGAMIWWCHCSTHGERGGKAAGGWVAQLILLVVVSVRVVFCVLCCLQNNPVFSSVTISHILKKIMSYVFWQVPTFINQITT
jgi:hypothetical protein